MFSRIATVLLALAFSVSALANPTSGVKQAFDDFKFTMEVEGAALSPEATVAAREVLQARLSELAKEGVTQQDMITAALNEVKNAEVREQFADAMVSIEVNALSQSEAQALIQDIMKNSSQTGANWSGSANAFVGGIVFLAIIYAIVVYTADCDEDYSQRDCSNVVIDY